MYPTYKGKFKDGTRSKNIHIAERKILEGFVDKIREMVMIYEERNYAEIVEEFKHPEILRDALDKIRQEGPSENPFFDLSKIDPVIADQVISELVDDFLERDMSEDLMNIAAHDLGKDILSKSPTLEAHKLELQGTKNRAEKLEKEKEELERERIQYVRGALKQGLNNEIVQQGVQEIENDIKRINEQILELSS